ncbi:hypothetical protein T459_21315 [Capsicum annuum]|uniref:Uncharacterized protein n=1 Tax=Capsicum annuum TaxID=4072 RepID=A0A2G2YW93_CAPAN|nr:hypothetical protein T459_21315 [Capsicum annuum]
MVVVMVEVVGDGRWWLTMVTVAEELLHKISGAKSRLVSDHKKVDAIIEDVLNEHIENKVAGKKGNVEFRDEDLVDVFLRDIFLSGIETSSIVVIWAFAKMMKNPHVMAKAQSEVRQVFTGKKIYDEEDVETLTYLKLAVKEALRLHLPVPFIGPNECRDKTNITVYTIPFKTRVLVNAWPLARDPESWNDPQRSIPERFEDSFVDFIGNHFQLILFGAGRRIRPGILFGLANVTHSLAQLLLF